MQRYASEKIVYRMLLDVSAAAAIGLTLVHRPDTLAPRARVLAARVRRAVREQDVGFFVPLNP